MSHLGCVALDNWCHFALLSAPTFVCDEPPAFGSGKVLWECWFSFGKSVFFLNLYWFKKKSEMQSDWLGNHNIHDFI